MHFHVWVSQRLKSYIRLHNVTHVTVDPLRNDTWRTEGKPLEPAGGLKASGYGQWGEIIISRMRQQHGYCGEVQRGGGQTNLTFGQHHAAQFPSRVQPCD
jgi:hypothetical protein